MKNPVPLVSVVIPTYKRPAEVLRAVKSVLAQDYPDMEILVVDDNPPESEYRRKTEAALEGLDPRIVHIRNAASLGGAGARNAGIQAARGKFSAFLDDDDEWLPGKLNKQMALFETLPENVCGVDTGFYEIDERKGTKKVVLPELRGRIFDDLLVKHRGRAPKLSSLVCRTAALREAGMFDPALPSRQDLDLYLRLARFHAFEYIPEPLTVKYIHLSDRISASIGKKVRGYDMLYAKYRADLEARPKLHRMYLRRHAVRMIRGGQIAAGIKKLIKSCMIR
jgi:glycosyltransferase involved in cell wall biosynthesis